MQVDTYSYGAYISALCRVGKLQEAVALVDTMPSRNVKPNLVIYNTLLHGAVTGAHVFCSLMHAMIAGAIFYNFSPHRTTQ